MHGIGNTQECGGISVAKPSAADEAIEILSSAYKSSNISEIARREMHNINEMVGIQTLKTIFPYNIAR